MSSSVPTESTTEGRGSVSIGVGVSIGVLVVIVATAIVITISVTVWLKRKNKLMTTTDNVLIQKRWNYISDNVAYFKTTVSGADTNKAYDYVSTNARNDIIIGTSPNEAYGATVAGDLYKYCGVIFQSSCHL